MCYLILVLIIITLSIFCSWWLVLVIHKNLFGSIVNIVIVSINARRPVFFIGKCRCFIKLHVLFLCVSPYLWRGLVKGVWVISLLSLRLLNNACVWLLSGVCDLLLVYVGYCVSYVLFCVLKLEWHIIRVYKW